MTEHAELVFEKDDEGKYRMLQEQTHATVDQELVIAIVDALVQIQA